ncbi:conserved hypothetical protein [Leishmania infantum JPCM5]|uniref:IQ_calmodulin-binding_motif_containing_protein_-_putative n=2 Tax=Leishmania infantum TaxID=5671 RepID=A4I9Y0_LEIIN|nr:conserved hypothetical protein [Leishmania infantum JPCM5]CAM71634.1 conserved hypothetical protein [Leishmania infantum JPCM5]|eukprot:XP_001468549.1 conserved hypothetical protein [Leishmania infantum JPCM5]
MKGVSQRGLRGSSLALSRSNRTSKEQRGRGQNSVPRCAATSPSPRTAAALVPPTTQQLQHAPLVAFTQWNEAAMEALRNGEGDSSRRILSALLPVLEARLHAMQCKPSAHTSSTAIESWRLAHALTLNNYGCQLRRDGLTGEALRQFLRAKQVETLVFGKPSCSTMLNLSAVLLSSGAAEEALAISKECVMAAQDGEPILFITALHNLAVALGQQTSERERKAALPTMLQALREAQSALGEQHATTLMLKEKCGLTSGWFSQDRGPEAGPEVAAPVPAVESPSVHGTLHGNSAAQSPSPAPLTAQEIARAALHTLDFGEPVHAHPAAHAVAALDAAEPANGDSNGWVQDAYPASSLRPSPNADARSQSYAGRATEDNQDSLLSPPRQSTHLDSVTDVDAVRATHLRMPLVESALPKPLQVSSRQSSAAASVDQQCLNSVNLSGMQRSVAIAPLETVLQEPFQTASLVMSRSVPNLVGPAGPIRDLYKMDSADGKRGPVFLRFSLPPRLPAASTVSLPLRKVAPQGAAAGPSGASAEGRRRKPSPATMPPSVSKWSGDSNLESSTAATLITEMPTAGDVKTVDKDERPFSKTGGRATLPSAPQRSLFGCSGSLYARRTVRREVEKQEERAYRVQREAEKKAAEAETAFQLALQKIQCRTQNTAAVTIQHAWRQWWSAVGRTRRDVQLQRLEELQRRRRERLALGFVAGKMPGRSGKVTIPPPPSQQHGHVGGYVVPAIVLRCCRKWLANTVCVRHVAKSHRSLVDGRLHEADVRRGVCRIQALWRGSIVRHRRAEHQQQPQLDGENACVIAVSAAYRRRAEAELLEYSALVLQQAYRSYRARQLRRRLYAAKHNGPAAVIQRWLRCTLADQRNRGVDSRTIRVRDAAARTIQRVWRGYVGRVAFRMRELRLRMGHAGVYPFALEAGIGTARRLAAIDDREGRAAKHISAKTSTPPSPAAVKRAGARPCSGKPDSFAAGKAALDLNCTAALVDAYAADCLQRSGEVYRLRDAERDRYHIGLYVDVRATRERQAWQESLRLRSTEVLRRRAAMDTRIHEEQRAFTEHRAALAIQRAYRAWRRMQEDKGRNTDFLYYSRALYQQHELGSLAARKQRQRDTARAIALYGDSAMAMRAERVKAAEELALVADCNGPASSSSGPNGVIAAPHKGAMKISSYAERMARKQQRQEQEAMQRRDEVLVALTYPHDMAHAREGPDECAARTGTTYEHPYYIPYVNEEHCRTLGID